MGSWWRNSPALQDSRPFQFSGSNMSELLLQPMNPGGCLDPTGDAAVLSHPPAVQEEQLVPGLCRGLPGAVPALPGARAAAGAGGPEVPSPCMSCTKSSCWFVKPLRACASSIKCSPTHLFCFTEVCYTGGTCHMAMLRLNRTSMRAQSPAESSAPRLLLQDGFCW